MTLTRHIAFVVLVALPALHGGCARRSDLRILRKMPMVVEAVVAPEFGRLFPSAAGPGQALIIPDNAFALSATLAEVRASVAPNDSNITVTIAPGDRVEILVPDDDPQGLCLIRTISGTYCWLSAGNLIVGGNS